MLVTVVPVIRSVEELDPFKKNNPPPELLLDAYIN
jgi:hypothetical protein